MLLGFKIHTTARIDGKCKDAPLAPNLILKIFFLPLLADIGDTLSTSLLTISPFTAVNIREDPSYCFVCFPHSISRVFFFWISKPVAFVHLH